MSKQVCPKSTNFCDPMKIDSTIGLAQPTHRAATGMPHPLFKMTTHERALQIYQVLTCAARNRQILTYEIVADLIGVPRQGLAPHLKHIMRFCDRNKLPPLTVLVVGKTSGKPGKGLVTVNELSRDIERVFNHPWYRMKPLTVEDLKVGDLVPFYKAVGNFKKLISKHAKEDAESSPP